MRGYAFGVFELSLDRRELRRQGIRLHLQDKPFDLLVALVENAGREVSREEIHQRLWPDGTFVDFEAGINTAMHKLRQALGDAAQSARYIETHARRGYCFVAVVRILGVEPAVRVQTPQPTTTTPEVRARRRSAWGLTLAALGLVAVVATSVAVRRAAGPRPIRSLAVLPLTDYSEQPDEYFAAGMTEALTTELARLSALRVISNGSARRFAGSDRSLTQIAGKLQVDAVIEGSIVRSGDFVRLTAELIDGRTDVHLWADRFESRRGDVLRLQAELAASVAHAIELELSPAQTGRLARAPAIDPEAHDAYLRGRYFWNQRTPAGLQKALAEFERALRLEPKWAPAWAGLADAWSLLAISGYDIAPPAEAMPRAREAASRALELDPTLAEARTSIAWIAFTFEWDFARAEREFRAAIALNPSYPTAHQWYSNLLCALGRFAEAKSELEAALALDPLSLVVNSEAAWPDYYAGRHDLAIARYESTLELDPNYPKARLELGQEYAALGDWDRAIEEYERFSELTGRSSTALAYLAHAEGARGDRQRAEALAAELGERAKSSYIPPYEFALVALGLGDRDAAFAALDRAFADHSDYLVYLAVEPLFAELHDDPRFRRLLERTGLPSPLEMR